MLKDDFMQTLSEVQEFNDYLERLRKYCSSTDQLAEYAEAVLPYINRLIETNRSLMSLLKNNSIFDLHTRLQSLTNQCCFDLEQLQGVADCVKTVEEVDSNEMSLGDAVSKLKGIRNFLSESKDSLNHAQYVINKGTVNNEKCYTDSANMIDYTLEKYDSSEVKNNVDAQTYKPYIRIAQEMNDMPEDYMWKTDEIISPLLDEIKLGKNKIVECLNGKRLELADLSALKHSYEKSVEYLHSALPKSEEVYRSGIKYVYERTFSEKIKLCKEQLDIQSTLGASPEFNSKLNYAIDSQIVSLDRLFDEEVTLIIEDRYMISSELREELANIITKVVSNMEQSTSTNDVKEKI